MRLYDDEAVMKKMGLDFELLDSGCCGMAGSFGYEEDKYDVSAAVRRARALSRGAQGRAFDAGDGRRLQLPGTDSAGHAPACAAPGRGDADGAAGGRCLAPDVSRRELGQKKNCGAASFHATRGHCHGCARRWRRSLVGRFSSREFVSRILDKDYFRVRPRTEAVAAMLP